MSEQPTITIAPCRDEDGGFYVRAETATSTFPMTWKASAREAVARAAQLLGIRESIEPQSYPEVVQIGEIGTDSSEPAAPAGPVSIENLMEALADSLDTATDEEVVGDCRSRGDDPHEIAERTRSLLRDTLRRCRTVREKL